jgi:hypothetical protein
MVRTKDELINALKGFIGEDDSDNAISLLEDVSDTFSDFETKVSDPEDWKKKFEENDKAWRKKYTDRFSTPVDKPADEVEPNETGTTENNEAGEKELTFEELFKTE